MNIDIIKKTAVSRSIRARQLEALFDVPPATESTQHWQGDLPIEDKPWNVGLIVGPSGSGKSSVMREVFGEMPSISWGNAGVVDDFSSALTMEQISHVCQAVGFNTIPAWIRPYSVLSTGEQFRVELARRLLEQPDPVVVDEFSSVVDRQIAKIGAHAVQKYARKNNRKFVAVTCHYDVIDWLQPDWVLEMPLLRFSWRSLQRRPQLDCAISRVPYAAWSLFAPFHYLTAKLHHAARCFVLFVNGAPAAFAGMLHRPHPKVRDILGCSRLLTLPDWQGMGLALVLIDKLGGAYKAIGKRVHTYPAHPALIRSFGRSPAWAMVKSAGKMSTARSPGSSFRYAQATPWLAGNRPCAVFAYRGAALPKDEALRVLGAP